MTRIAFAVPGDLDTPTGGFAYDRRIIAELRRRSCAVEVIDLGSAFPLPDATARAAAVAALAAVPDGTPTIIDGLAFGALPELAGTLCRRLPVIALVHHPLASEWGLADETAARLQASECTALAGARRVIVTSATTAGLLASAYGVPPDRITVACPGTEPVGVYAGRPDRSGAPVALLAVGAIVPRKGYDLLVAALSRVADLDWHLIVAGTPDRDAAAAARLREQIAALGLATRVTLAGAVPDARLPALYTAADLFVHAAWFEGYGMACAQAVRHGLPVVGTAAGAIVETVPAGAGVLVAPGDVPALAAALRSLIGNPDERARVAAAAGAAASGLPTWETAAQRFAAAIEAVT